MKLSDEAKNILVTGGIVGGLVLFFCARRKQGPDEEVVGFGPRAPMPANQPGFSPPGAPQASPAPMPQATQPPVFAPASTFGSPLPTSPTSPLPSPAPQFVPSPSPGGGGATAPSAPGSGTSGPQFSGPIFQPTFAQSQAPTAPSADTQTQSTPTSSTPETAQGFGSMQVFPTFELVPEDRTESASTETEVVNPFSGVGE